MKIIVMKSRKLSRGRENNLAKVNVNILTPLPKVAVQEDISKQFIRDS